eukprot:4230931-Karenia_brevis.AAC.1
MEDTIDGGMCKDAIYILTVAIAVGIDVWPPADLRRLLKDALAALAQILQEVEHKATWPSHALYNNIMLMGKPRGGARPIAPYANALQNMDANSETLHCQVGTGKCGALGCGG